MNIDSLLNTDALGWIKYSNYEIFTNNHGEAYIKPATEANIQTYNPAPIFTEIMLEAANIGYEHIQKGSIDSDLQTKTFHFVRKYGLLGMFNYFIDSDFYLHGDSLTLKPNVFFGKPKIKIDQYAKNFLLNDNFMPNSHNYELDIATRSIGRDIVPDFIFTKNYCESMEWIISIFDKIAKTLVYYCDNANSHSTFDMDSSFRINGLSFEVETKDAPTLIWNYVSLAHLIEAVFGFYLCDKNSPLRICKHCKNIFISKLASTEFCSPQCRNQFNVYKSRAKKD